MTKAQCIGFLNTPSLWTGKQFDIISFEFPQLELDSFVPEPIPQNIRLGHQMEHVCKQLLSHSNAYEVILHNLAVREKQRTLGEIDFILKNVSHNKLIHVELTYKFYLIDPKIEQPIHRLIGPNRRDRFFEKMEKIKNVQFPLLHTQEGAKALNESGIDPSQVEHQCCFKAQLYRPYESIPIHMDNFNTACLAGFWLRFDHFKSSEFSNSQFYIPTKSEWIISPHDKVAWKSHLDILTHVQLKCLDKISQLLWRKKTDGIFEKLFVVW